MFHIANCLTTVCRMAAAFTTHSYLDDDYLKGRRLGSKGPKNPNDHTNKNKGAWGSASKKPLNKRKALQAARNKK